MAPIPEIDGAAIVILGSFNPAIFHPSWFRKQGLLRDEEAETAELDVTHPDLSAFHFEGFRLEVVKERFIVEAKDPSFFELIRDVVLGTFSLLEHTPATAMGLNRQMHFAMPSEEKWDAFGNYVAPKGPWNQIMNRPGLMSLTIKDPKEKEAEHYVRMKVETSKRVEPGLYFQVNYHYKAIEDDISSLMEILKGSWEKDIADSLAMAQNLLEQEY